MYLCQTLVLLAAVPLLFVSALPAPQETNGCASSGESVSRRALASCASSTPGLTFWSDAEFSGTSRQYNVSWNTCISIAADFPYQAAAGVSSLAANSNNWCTVYPNSICDEGQGRGNDTLDVVGSYYDLADPEEAWDNLPQSFSCRPYECS